MRKIEKNYIIRKSKNLLKSDQLVKEFKSRKLSIFSLILFNYQECEFIEKKWKKSFKFTDRI